MERFCSQLPKIELHAHLNGSLSRSTLQKLGCLEDSINTYQTVDTKLDDVFSLFKVAHKATSNSATLYTATKDVIEEFAADNVIYLELRTTPRAEENMSLDQYIKTVVNAIEDRISTNIIVKLLLSIDRAKPYKEQAELLDVIISYRNKYPYLIKGIDLSGDPSKGEFHNDLFERARKNQLKVAIHCAEMEYNDEVDRILAFKPDRIGHGTCLHPNYGGNIETWQKYKKLGIPVECCLTSNVVCLTSKSYKEHHANEWLKDSMPFCLGTDDKGVFNTSLSKEFALAQEAFNLSKLDLWRIAESAIGYSFANDEEKGFLSKCLAEFKKTYLQSYLQ